MTRKQERRTAKRLRHQRERVITVRIPAEPVIVDRWIVRFFMSLRRMRAW